MKKSLLSILFLIFLLQFAFFVRAANLQGLQEDLDSTKNKLEDVKGTVSDLTEEDVRNEYLKKEWTGLIEKMPLTGSYLKLINGFFTLLNPFFKTVLGVEYSLSWAFIFAVLIWFTLFLFLYPISTTLFSNAWFGFLASFILSSLVGLSGVIKNFVDILSLMINNTWIAWIALFIAIIFLLIIKIFGRILSKRIKNAKEKAAKEKEKMDRKVLDVDAKVTKKKLDSYDKS